MATPLGLISQAQIIAQQLGINTWQIQTGSYNGVAFHVVPSVLAQLNKLLNPAAGIVDATQRLIGIGSLDTNNTNLPYGTGAISLGITDSGTRKLKVHTLPNSNDVFEDLGWYGETITVTGILFGSAYSQALNNILNNFLNDSSVPAINRNVLVHPILGRMPNTYLQSYKRIHNPNMWRSCMYEFTFRTSVPLAQISNTTPTILSKLNQSISAILTIATALLNTWGTIKVISNSFGNAGNSNNIQLPLMNTQASIQETVNINLTVTKLLVNNLQPPGYTNVALINTVTTPVNNLPFINYFDANMTPSDVNTIIEFNNTSTNACIAVINQVNNNTIYDSITSLLSAQANINELAISLLNSFYGITKQFIVPYDIDMFNLCFINNLDYLTDASIIWSLNKGIITSNNYIPKGTNLLIPIGNDEAVGNE